MYFVVSEYNSNTFQKELNKMSEDNWRLVSAYYAEGYHFGVMERLVDDLTEDSIKTGYIPMPSKQIEYSIPVRLTIGEKNADV